MGQTPGDSVEHGPHMSQMEPPDEIVFWDEPCPRCRSSLRYVKSSEPGKVFCDGCGYVEGEAE